MPTLFVLGAGASKPYGLPLGSELRTLICESPGNAPARAATASGEYSEHDVRDLARAFHRSNVKSIDEFLERLPHLAGVGKTLIAAILCAKENPDEIFSEHNSDHWYRILWSKLVESTLTGTDFRQNNVRFITFNYDRSLEYFLHESTKGAYGLDDATSFSHWSRLPIMHVYGSVGDFSFAEGTNVRRPYYIEARGHELGSAAASIHIIPEGRDDTPAFRHARQWFDWAQNVYILGFGFDRQNCDRLGFASVLRHNANLSPPKPPPVIHASVFQLTPVEVTRARQHLLGDDGNWFAYNEKCSMTLRLAGLPD